MPDPNTELAAPQLKLFLNDVEFIAAVCHRVTPALFCYRFFVHHRMRIIDLTAKLFTEVAEDIGMYAMLETFKDVGDAIAHDIKIRIEDIPKEVRDSLTTSLEYTFFPDHLQSVLHAKHPEWYKARVRMVSFDFPGVKVI